MKQVILLSAALLGGLLSQSAAQNQTQKAATGVSSQPGGSAKNNTSSVDAMKRRGSGKMASGITRSGNSNLSPTAPTNTQGSTSQGSASVPSAGGARGTRTTAAKPANRSGNVPNRTASDGGQPTKGRVSTQSTSGATGGSKRPTSAGAVQKEARTSDKNVSTNGPKPTGVGKSGTPSGSASGKNAGGNSTPQTGGKN